MPSPKGMYPLKSMVVVVRSFLSILIIVRPAFADSTLSAVWISGGGVLTIDIKDDPSSPAFTAGEIWSWMTNKSIKTDNFEVKCSGVRPIPIGSPYGSCKIQIQKSTCVDNGSKLNCGIWKDEAVRALQGFVSSPEDILVHYSGDDFIFEANQQQRFVGFVISKKFVH
jgi:hypothetical protein